MAVVNGMSTATRSSKFANSGLVVEVRLGDLSSTEPLAGIEFQRRIEAATYTSGGGGHVAPASRASDFVRRRHTGKLADSHFRPALVAADLEAVLPAFITTGMRAGLRQFDRKLKGYASEAANLIGSETRTSSPIRIPRDKDRFEVPGFGGLYVAGEGPGYAGGIASAAADGLELAGRILRHWSARAERS